MDKKRPAKAAKGTPKRKKSATIPSEPEGVHCETITVEAEIHEPPKRRRSLPNKTTDTTNQSKNCKIEYLKKTKMLYILYGLEPVNDDVIEIDDYGDEENTSAEMSVNQRKSMSSNTTEDSNVSIQSEGRNARDKVMDAWKKASHRIGRVE